VRKITFYSYKGGVGRTLAAANLGVFLAKSGKKTVLIDFDLDGPGLTAKFHLDIKGKTGLLDYLLHFQTTENDDFPLKDIVVDVPIDDANKGALKLIHAGDYHNLDYFVKLYELSSLFRGGYSRVGWCASTGVFTPSQSVCATPHSSQSLRVAQSGGWRAPTDYHNEA